MLINMGNDQIQDKSGRFMKFLKITAGVLTASMMLTGCTTTKNILSKRNNGSLDYRNEKNWHLFSCQHNNQLQNLHLCIIHQIR